MISASLQYETIQRVFNDTTICAGRQLPELIRIVVCKCLSACLCGLVCIMAQLPVSSQYKDMERYETKESLK